MYMLVAGSNTVQRRRLHNAIMSEVSAQTSITKRHNTPRQPEGIPPKD
jgi:hypothetical protein